jgi:hypothetical protein
MSKPNALEAEKRVLNDEKSPKPNRNEPTKNTHTHPRPFPRHSRKRKVEQHILIFDPAELPSLKVNVFVELHRGDRLEHDDFYLRDLTERTGPSTRNSHTDCSL